MAFRFSLRLEPLFWPFNLSKYPVGGVKFLVLYGFCTFSFNTDLVKSFLEMELGANAILEGLIVDSPLEFETYIFSGFVLCMKEKQHPPF